MTLNRQVTDHLWLPNEESSTTPEIKNSEQLTSLVWPWVNILLAALQHGRESGREMGRAEGTTPTPRTNCGLKRTTLISSEGGGPNGLITSH